MWRGVVVFVSLDWKKGTLETYRFLDPDGPGVMVTHVYLLFVSLAPNFVISIFTYVILPHQN